MFRLSGLVLAVAAGLLTVGVAADARGQLQYTVTDLGIGALGLFGFARRRRRVK
jgi:hypothetical protein